MNNGLIKELDPTESDSIISVSLRSIWVTRTRNPTISPAMRIMKVSPWHSLEGFLSEADF